MKPKYRVQWTDIHDTIVEAIGEDDAYETALEVDAYTTFKNSTLTMISAVSDTGYCSDHDLTVEGVVCPQCAAIDQAWDYAKDEENEREASGGD